MSTPIRSSLCSVLLAAACTNHEVEVPEWEVLDVDGLRNTLDNPTARFADDPALDALQDALTNPSAESSLDDAANALLDFLEGDDGGGGEEGTGEAGDTGEEEEGSLGSGTTVYLEIACPGPNDTLDPDFAFGRIRVDGPRLTQEVIENFAVEGDLLLSFIDCSVGGVTYNGLAPAHYLVGDSPELAADLSLDVLDGETGATSRLERAAIFNATQTRLTQPSSGGGTYTLEIDNAGTTTLRAADGVLSCVVATGVCTGP